MFSTGPQHGRVRRHLEDIYCMQVVSRCTQKCMPETRQKGVCVVPGTKNSSQPGVLESVHLAGK